MNTSFTSGPWFASCIGYGSNIKPDIAWIGYGSSHPKEVHKANARLIASAPELLLALNDLHEYTRATYSGYRNALTQAEDELYLKVSAAISKATGQEP